MLGGLSASGTALNDRAGTSSSKSD